MQSEFRHEYKHVINKLDETALRARLRLGAKPDPHAENDGTYIVRSLYFDTPQDTALREKLDGVDRRMKFRIRYYNDHLEQMQLEKKMKVNGLCRKESVPISQEQCKWILDGQYDWLKEQQHPLLQEFYIRLRTGMYRPKSVVIYRREAFVYPAGNVRITIDSELRRSACPSFFLQPDGDTVPLSHEAVLEIKYDGYLPHFLVDLCRISGRKTQAYSKYAISRL